VKDVYSQACLPNLYALEGAVQEKPWYGIDKNRKAALKEFFNHL
jgi:hypothetical protein